MEKTLLTSLPVYKHIPYTEVSALYLSLDVACWWWGCVTQYSLSLCDVMGGLTHLGQGTGCRTNLIGLSAAAGALCLQESRYREGER